MVLISDPQFVPRVGEFPDAELQYSNYRNYAHPPFLS